MKKFSRKRIAAFQELIFDYYQKYGRALPWRNTSNPYRILVSEFMLQQTQVRRVLLKYNPFLKKFPDLKTLSHASLREVLQEWQGLGYNRRALMLHKLAKRVVAEYGGKLPRDSKLLNELPGVGKGTAGAICTFAFNQPAVFIETNIRRVFIHHFFSKKASVADTEIFPFIEQTLDAKNPRAWYYALMDYGAELGRTSMRDNPNKKSSHYAKQSKFAGSDRELRGKIIKLVVAQKSVAEKRLAGELAESPARIKKVLQSLEKETFIMREKGMIYTSQ